jgi:hypothetical protein
MRIQNFCVTLRNNNQNYDFITAATSSINAVKAAMRALKLPLSCVRRVTPIKSLFLPAFLPNTPLIGLN